MTRMSRQMAWWGIEALAYPATHMRQRGSHNIVACRRLAKCFFVGQGAASSPSAHQISAQSSRLAGAFAASAALGFGLSGSPLLADDRSSEFSSISSEDETRLASALKETLETIVSWVDCPDSGWNEQRPSRIRGLEEVCMRSRQSDGVANRVFVGSAVFDDATLLELLALAEGVPGCAKERFDPSLDRVERLHKFSSSWCDVEVLRSYSNSVLLGLISPREVDLLATTHWLADGRLAHFGVGLQAPTVAAHTQGSAGLEALQASPPSPGNVRAVALAMGYIMEPLDSKAASGRRGRCRLWVCMHVDPGGGLPSWLTDRGQPKAITDFLAAARKELAKMRAKAED